MIETKTRTIDGVAFSCTQFTARRGLGLQARILRLAGDSIAEAFTLLAKIKAPKGGSMLDADLTGINASPIMQKLAEGLAREDIAALAAEVMSNTTMDGKQISEGVFDMEFVGKYDTLAKALWFVCETNGFFKVGGIGGMLQTLTPPKAGEPQAG